MLKARVPWLTHSVSPSRRLRKAACLSVLVLLPCLGTASAETIIGHIADLRGDWQLYPGGADSTEMQRLAKGQGVPSGAAIRIKSPSSRDYIVIIGLDLNVLEQRRCQGIETCYSPILLPKTPERAVVADGLVSLLSDVWARLEHETYLPSLFRMRGPRIMTDGVVAWRDHSLDLGDILWNAKPGRYVLTRTEGVGGPDTGTQRMLFAWNPEITTIVPAADLSPGLFDVDEYSVEATRAPRMILPLVFSSVTPRPVLVPLRL
jgi:hypothetical protein